MLLPLLLVTTAAFSYPPQGYKLGEKQESPKYSFRLEIWEKEHEGFFQHSVWVVAADKSHAQLLVGPDKLTELYSVEVYISPDERWIMWEQKLYHGADAFGLYERINRLRYREIGPPIFSEQAWRFMSEETHRKFTLAKSIHVMRVSDWPTPSSRTRKLALYGGPENTPVTAPNDHSLAISLYGDDDKTLVNLWFCFYDLETHQFYLNAALQEHNRGRVGPSRKKK